MKPSNLRERLAEGLRQTRNCAARPRCSCDEYAAMAAVGEWLRAVATHTATPAAVPMLHLLADAIEEELAAEEAK